MSVYFICILYTIVLLGLFYHIIKTHGSEVRAAKKLRSARPIKRRGHYCDLFTCRVGFAILALDYATSLNGFVLSYVIKKCLAVVFLRPC